MRYVFMNSCDSYANEIAVNMDARQSDFAYEAFDDYISEGTASYVNLGS